MKIIAITQARTGSTRFPNKIMNKIENETLLSIHINRIKKSKKINSIIIATTNKEKDDIIELESNKLNVSCYRGEEEDVLDRFYRAAKPYKPDFVVRLTSDCPLIDPSLIDMIIEATINANVDYCSNTLIESYPDGQDVEVFSFNSLKKAWEESVLMSDREHVTPYMKKNFKVLNVHSNNMKFNKVRMTVDEPNDFVVIKRLVDKLGLNEKWENYTNLYLNDKTISNINVSITRNEGYIKSIKNDLNN
ncbi:cytidylyltransferase domain-containing protein [Polaribacter sp.]|uniref:cytidylyltransferase domain-containing protein n=1 Tax=Polaribacter sp. TaxID=1920175 RepID=UPI0040488FF0